MQAEATKKKEEITPKRKTLEALFHEACAVELPSALMHQAFQVPGAGTENSLNTHRMRGKQFAMVYHPGYGLIGRINGRYFLTPSANVVAMWE